MTPAPLSEWIEVPADEVTVASAFADEALSESPDDEHWLVVEDLTSHWLSVNPGWDGVYHDGDDHWEVTLQHPAACARRGPGGEAPCGVAWLVESQGLDEALGIVPETQGRWRLRFVHESLNLGGRGTEQDIRIEWIDDPEKPGLELLP